MSKSSTLVLVSTTKDQKRETEKKHRMRRFTKFLEIIGWMFVGACKRVWYKLRMNLKF